MFVRVERTPSRDLTDKQFETEHPVVLGNARTCWAFEECQQRYLRSYGVKVGMIALRPLDITAERGQYSET
jgi:hypothetical protein